LKLEKRDAGVALMGRKREQPRTKMIGVEDIEVGKRHRKADQKKVAQLVASMQQIGLKTPITIRAVDIPDDPDQFAWHLVTGAHRLAAAKKLGWQDIEVFVLEGDDADAELWEIDENLVRAELDAAQHALLTKRRAEIIEAKAALVSQDATPIKKRRGGRGGVHGTAAASVRDQAKKTGESKDKVARSKRRADKLGEETLQRVVGTSLGSGAQLDALAKLNVEKREELIKQVEAGEDVSAVRALAAEAAPSMELPKPTGDDKVDDLSPIKNSKTVEDEIAEPEVDLEEYRELVEALLDCTPNEICESILIHLGVDRTKIVVRALKKLQKRLLEIKRDCPRCNGTGFALFQTFTACGMPIGQVRMKCDCGQNMQGGLATTGADGGAQEEAQRVEQS
jgi:ParB/RepB/Spo0J family partition protein